MASLVPPPNTRGLYSLKAPFDALLKPTELYLCAAIRSFKDVENNGGDVFANYYQPYNLSAADASRDRKEGVMIITLLSDTYAPVYVPSSYILQYPNLSARNYQRVVLSVDLGPLPDSLDLTFVKTQVAQVVASSFGVTPKVNVAIAPMSGVVSPEDADAREAARRAGISNSTTDYARFLAEQAKRVALEQRIKVLEQILKDKKLLP